jgi:hypothetical protein
VRGRQPKRAGPSVSLQAAIRTDSSDHDAGSSSRCRRPLAAQAAHSACMPSTSGGWSSRRCGSRSPRGIPHHAQRPGRRQGSPAGAAGSGVTDRRALSASLSVTRPPWPARAARCRHRGEHARASRRLARNGSPQAEQIAVRRAFTARPPPRAGPERAASARRPPPGSAAPRPRPTRGAGPPVR